MSIFANTQGVGLTRVPREHWSYSGDPAATVTVNGKVYPKDRVRWLSGDVVEDDRLVSDAEILAALDDEGSDPRRAAAACLEFAAALFAREADRENGDTRLALSQRSTTFAKRAQGLRDRSATTATLGAMPYTGGISAADKRANDADSDAVPPLFTRESFGNGGLDAED